MPQTPWGFKPVRRRVPTFKGPTGKFISKDEAKRLKIRPKYKYFYVGPGGKYLKKDTYEKIRDEQRENKKNNKVVYRVRPKATEPPKIKTDKLPVHIKGKLWSYRGRFINEETVKQIIETLHRERTDKAQARHEKRLKKEAEEKAPVRHIVYSKKLWELITFRDSPDVRDILEAVGIYGAIDSIRGLRSSRFTIRAKVSIQIEIPGERNPRLMSKRFEAVVDRPQWKEMPERLRKKTFTNVYDFGVPSVDLKTTLIYAIWSAMRDLIKDVGGFLGESPNMAFRNRTGVNLQHYLDEVTIIQERL